MKSLDSKFHETVTAYQEAEALSCAIAILTQWRDLAPLAEPLKKTQQELLELVQQQAPQEQQAYTDKKGFCYDL